MKKCKIKNLVMDEKLLELRPVNSYFVSRYRQAMRSGAQFPAPIVEKGTNRIVSGNHRVSAYKEEYGDDHVIEVVAEVFPDEASIIRKFAEENNSHGNPLSGISQKSIIQSLLKHGDTPETVAQVLNIPVKKVKSLGSLSVLVIGKGKKSECRPIKHGLEHMTGRKVQEKQYNEHRQADRGVHASYLARQLNRWLVNEWIDTTDEHTMQALEELQASLNIFMEQKVAAVG